MNHEVKKEKPKGFLLLPITIALLSTLSVTGFLLMGGLKGVEAWFVNRQSEGALTAQELSAFHRDQLVNVHDILTLGLFFSLLELLFVLPAALFATSSNTKAIWLTGLLWIVFMSGVFYAASYTYNLPPKF